MQLRVKAWVTFLLLQKIIIKMQMSKGLSQTFLKRNPVNATQVGKGAHITNNWGKQTQTSVQGPLSPVGMTAAEIPKDRRVQRCAERRILRIAGEEINQHSQPQNNRALPQEIKHSTQHMAHNASTGQVSKGDELGMSKRNSHSRVYCSTIYSS